MKTSLRIIMILFLIVFIQKNCFAEDYNFRKTKWGMSIAQVKSSEPLTTGQEQPDMLLYKDSVINKDVFIGYFFVNNQLVRASYLSAESHFNNNDYINDYNDFKEILTKKYGNPIRDDKRWKDDLYKDDYSGWGMAIAIGHLAYFSSWETPDTEIVAALMGDNFKITCGVEYKSKKLVVLEDKTKEEKALDNF